MQPITVHAPIPTEITCLLSDKDTTLYTYIDKLRLVFNRMYVLDYEEVIDSENIKLVFKPLAEY